MKNSWSAQPYSHRLNICKKSFDSTAYEIWHLLPLLNTKFKYNIVVITWNYVALVITLQLFTASVTNNLRNAGITASFASGNDSSQLVMLSGSGSDAGI